MMFDVTVIKTEYQPRCISPGQIQLTTESSIKVPIDLDIIPMEELAKSGYTSLVIPDVWLNFVDFKGAKITFYVQGTNSIGKVRDVGTITGTLEKASWWKFTDATFTPAAKRVC